MEDSVDKQNDDEEEKNVVQGSKKFIFQSKNLSSFYKNRLIIDDLGVENKAFNSYELLEQLLFERHRYEALTFITTNISMTNVLERYGSRIADRIPQMCNIITWKGESFRHNI